MNKESEQKKPKKVKQHRVYSFCLSTKEKELDDLLTRMNIATDPSEKSVLFAWYTERSREA